MPSEIDNGLTKASNVNKTEFELNSHIDSTVLLYHQEHPAPLSSDATVLHYSPPAGEQTGGAPGVHTVILDQTCLYAQGGGQPCDQGTIKHPSWVLHVTSIKSENINNSLVVKHMGTLEPNQESEQELQKAVKLRGLNLHMPTSSYFKFVPPVPGQVVWLQADDQRRSLHCKFHSSGHIIDAIVECLELPWVPLKACHFPSSASVEYRIIKEEEEEKDEMGDAKIRQCQLSKEHLNDMQEMKKTLQGGVDLLISRDTPIRQRLITDQAQLPKSIKGTLNMDTLNQISDSHPFRLIDVHIHRKPIEKESEELSEQSKRALQISSSPCGGTHCQSTGECRGLIIEKVSLSSKDKNIIRVSYTVVENAKRPEDVRAEETDVVMQSPLHQQ